MLKINKKDAPVIAKIINHYSFNFPEGTSELRVYQNKLYFPAGKPNNENNNGIIVNNTLYRLTRKPKYIVTPLETGTQISDYKVIASCDFIAKNSNYIAFDATQEDKAFTYAIEKAKEKELIHSVLMLRAQQLDAEIKVLDKKTWKQIKDNKNDDYSINDEMKREFELNDDDLPF